SPSCTGTDDDQGAGKRPRGPVSACFGNEGRTDKDKTGFWFGARGYWQYRSRYSVECIQIQAYRVGGRTDSRRRDRDNALARKKSRGISCKCGYTHSNCGSAISECRFTEGDRFSPAGVAG